MRTDLYYLIPSRLLPAGLEKTSSTLDNARLNGTKMFVRTLCEGVVFVFCDVVSMWRAYVIYGRPRWLRTICIAIFVVSSGLYILIGIFYGPTLVANPPNFVTRLNREHGKFVFGLELAAFLTTAGAQVSSTVLIARKAWTHRRAVQSALSLDEGRSDYQRTTAVLYVVIESGLAYTLIWVLYVASAKSWFGPIGYYWGSFWMCQLSGIFPTLVVVIVSLRASILERSIVTTTGPTTTPIRFAVGGTDSETVVPQAILATEKLAV
ncbi:hypothetical protein PENSPDRAFT_670175 [Peniophora sp. CONT]|nr:hypothetical protein PENSPDRAFT_670175 [Peniophora sp. CONT]